MITSIKIKNYRSYSDEVIFSLEANSSDSNLKNVHSLSLTEDSESIRVLKSAIIYGPNASGKSNIIRAMFFLTKLILFKPKIGESIILYEPFLFDLNQNTAPSEFEIEFIGPNKYLYTYKVSLTSDRILEEKLDYKKGTSSENIFERLEFDVNSKVQRGKIMPEFGEREITVFANQLILSKFGEDEPDELLTEIYMYFQSIEVLNAISEKHREYHKKKVDDLIYNSSEFKRKLELLIKAADTKIKGINIKKINNSETKNLNDKAKKVIEKNPYIISGVHDIYLNDEVVGSEVLDFEKESMGSQLLYIIGGIILKIIETGGVLFADELDTSLHPFITKMIVTIFQSEEINTNNAQLIFTTHDVSLLDKDLVRLDQIWITEKNKRGSSDLYSLQDFENLSEDISFEKWYLAGKFGGLPIIKSIHSLFLNIDENE